MMSGFLDVADVLFGTWPCALSTLAVIGVCTLILSAGWNWG